MLSGFHYVQIKGDSLARRELTDERAQASFVS